jgi:hypothetical protein
MPAFYSIHVVRRAATGGLGATQVRPFHVSWRIARPGVAANILGE